MLCARVSSLGLWVGVICGSATAGLEEAATSRPSTSTSYRDPQPRCATTAALEGRSRCSTCRIRARGPALVPLAGCLRGPRALACLRGRWGSERLAGQLPRLHLDRLPCVHTRIERSHKLLQRWRWPCGSIGSIDPTEYSVSITAASPRSTRDSCATMSKGKILTDPE